MQPLAILEIMAISMGMIAPELPKLLNQLMYDKMDGHLWYAKLDNQVMVAMING